MTTSDGNDGDRNHVGGSDGTGRNETYNCAGCAGEVEFDTAMWLGAPWQTRASPFCCMSCFDEYVNRAGKPYTLPATITNRREWKLGERCAHSQLGRQCEVCQRDDEIAGLRAQVEGLRERVKCEAAEVDAIHAVEMFTGHIEGCYEDQTLAECPCSKLLESMFLATAANAAARLAIRTAGGGG